MRIEELTDAQWAILELLIPTTVRRADRRGRPQLHSDRTVLNGILWVLRTGAAWANLPDRFPSGCICFRRFTRWVESGVMHQILESLARRLEDMGWIDLSECFIDGTFVAAKKGRSKVGEAKRSKGTKLMVIADAHGLPLTVHTASASRYFITLVEATLDETVTVGRPRRLVGDRAYDSDPLDQKLAQCGTELIAPHRKNRVNPASRDGRPLRR